MFGFEDEASKDQELVDRGEMPKPKEKKIGLIWSTNGLIWFLERGSKEKRYVGALRVKKKNMTSETYKRLLRGDRIIMQYDAEDKEERNRDGKRKTRNMANDNGSCT